MLRCPLLAQSAEFLPVPRMLHTFGMAFLCDETRKATLGVKAAEGSLRFHTFQL